MQVRNSLTRTGTLPGISRPRRSRGAVAASFRWLAIALASLFLLPGCAFLTGLEIDPDAVYLGETARADAELSWEIPDAAPADAPQQEPTLLTIVGAQFPDSWPIQSARLELFEPSKGSSPVFTIDPVPFDTTNPTSCDFEADVPLPDGFRYVYFVADWLDAVDPGPTTLNQPNQIGEELLRGTLSVRFRALGPPGVYPLTFAVGTSIEEPGTGGPDVEECFITTPNLTEPIRVLDAKAVPVPTTDARGLIVLALVLVLAGILGLGVSRRMKAK